MSRVGAPSNLSKLFSIRVGNVPSDISSEKIYHDFSTFGEIGDFYRPKLLDHHVPSRFLFIRYYRSDSGYRAMMEMHGKVYGDRIITVHDANDQDSFFTQDTGYITNEKFDSPEKKAKEFDASLPYNHYELKHKQELSLQVDHVITLRVDEISTQISKEQLESIFSEFGEVCSIYYPIDLKTRTHRGFAFIRYSHEGAANLALKNMDDVNLGVGRNIRVSRCSTATYFSQDETATGKVLLVCRYLITSLKYTEQHTIHKVTLEASKHNMGCSGSRSFALSVRVDDISIQISEEKLESIFSEFGVISCMYYPIDQDTKTHRGFAFIRYTHEGAANLALKNMDDANLGVGRNIRVSRCTKWEDTSE